MMELQRSAALRFFLGFLLLSMANGRLVEKNSLRVTSPDKIKGTYDSAIGNFGIPQYGGSMAGAVVYPKENHKGCKEFSEFGITFKSSPGALPTFVLVDRGGLFKCRGGDAKGDYCSLKAVTVHWVHSIVNSPRGPPPRWNCSKQ